MPIELPAIVFPSDSTLIACGLPDSDSKLPIASPRIVEPPEPGAQVETVDRDAVTVDRDAEGRLERAPGCLVPSIVTGAVIAGSGPVWSQLIVLRRPPGDVEVDGRAAVRRWPR